MARGHAARTSTRSARRARHAPPHGCEPHVDPRADGIRQDDHVLRARRGARRAHAGARAPTQPRRPDRRRTRASFPRRRLQPGRSAGRRTPRRDDCDLPGQPAPPGHDGVGADRPGDLRRGAHHARRPDAAAARPREERHPRRLHRHSRDDHRTRRAGLRPGRRDPRPARGDQTRHPRPASQPAGGTGGRPVRRRARARRLRPGKPRTRTGPGAVAPGLRRRVGGAFRAARPGRGGLHRDRRAGARPRR